MKTINYDEISKIYDQVREEEIDIINSFLQEIEVSKVTTILDLGCGTGNYTNMLQRITRAKVYGVDASEGMLEKAIIKNHDIIFKLGLVTDIPYEDNYFNFVYMTDVIHHISDIGAMFSEIFRILKSKGKVCISTQSHRQIDLRYMSEFFPATAMVDKSRYPDINIIIKAAEEKGLKYYKEQIIDEGIEIELGKHYYELLDRKGYSMLHLISDKDYEIGLNKVKQEMINGSIKRKSAGETLIWFIKE